MEKNWQFFQQNKKKKSWNFTSKRTGINFVYRHAGKRQNTVSDQLIRGAYCTEAAATGTQQCLHILLLLQLLQVIRKLTQQLI